MSSETMPSQENQQDNLIPTHQNHCAEPLASLEQALAGTGRTAITQPQAITGLGGIGKTQLALHYAYDHLGDYDLIRWLPAEEPATLAAAYTGLSRNLWVDQRMVV
jgi:hypothetical protein